MELEKQKFNYNTHIYLYAKNWYKVGNIIDDLKIIMCERCGHYRKGDDPEKCKKYLHSGDIVDILLGIVYPLIVESGNPQYFFENFIYDIAPTNSWKVGYVTNQSDIGFNINDVVKPDYDYWTAVIHKCLSFIGNTEVNRILKIETLPIGEPDFELFPMFKREVVSENTNSK